MKSLLNFFKNQLKKFKNQEPSQRVEKKEAKKKPEYNVFNKPLYFSLEDLKKIGLRIEPVPKEVVNNELLVHASQLPSHLLPWLTTLESGTYRLSFPPKMEAQIYKGSIETRDLIDNSSPPDKKIGSHGLSVTRVLAHPLIMIYQVGVLVFGSYHLQKIGASLKNINRQLGKVYNFLLDKRSAQIRAYIQEFSHIAKGIVEFSKLGNVEEVKKRLDLIKEIRLMNLSNLLHLQKNLIDNSKELILLERSSWFGAKKEEQSLESSIKDYKRDLIDYTSSLYLDIITTKTEVFYSMVRSYSEIKSRIGAQKSGMKLLSNQKNSFEKTLFEKTKELIKKGRGGVFDIFTKDEEVSEAKRKIKNIWKDVKLLTEQFQENGGYHIQTIEESLNRKNKFVFLQVSKERMRKKNRKKISSFSSTNQTKTSVTTGDSSSPPLIDNKAS